MSVQIIRKDERLVFEYEASTFYYRRLPSAVRNRLLNDAKKRGEVNEGKYSSAALRYCVLGWDNVTDSEGAQVPFDRDMIDYLPEELNNELSVLVGAAVAKQEDDLGNS